MSSSRVCSTDDSELKEFLVDETLLQIFSTYKDTSKGIIIKKCSAEEDKSDFFHKNINKQKDANNETEYEESSVKDEVPSYFNRLECGRNILNRLDGTYERACMDTLKDKYFEK